MWVEGGGGLGCGYASSNYNYITPRQPDIKLQNTYAYMYTSEMRLGVVCHVWAYHKLPKVAQKPPKGDI